MRNVTVRLRFATGGRDGRHSSATLNPAPSGVRHSYDRAKVKHTVGGGTQSPCLRTSDEVHKNRGGGSQHPPRQIRWQKFPGKKEIVVVVGGNNKLNKQTYKKKKSGQFLGWTRAGGANGPCWRRRVRGRPALPLSPGCKSAAASGSCCCCAESMSAAIVSNFAKLLASVQVFVLGQKTEGELGGGGWEWATCVISGHNVPFHVRSTTTTAQSSRLLCTQRLFTPYVTQCYTLTWVLSVALGIFDSNSQINPKVTILSVCSASLSLVVVSHTLI